MLLKTHKPLKRQGYSHPTISFETVHFTMLIFQREVVLVLFCIMLPETKSHLVLFSEMKTEVLRSFVSRLFLDISCDRDSVMLGSAKDFWRLHPEMTDTDKLLNVATDKLGLVMNSGVRDLPDLESIIRCHVHDMFPYYLDRHVASVVRFVREGNFECVKTDECERSEAGDCSGSSHSPMALSRPPKPMCYSRDSALPDSEYVDRSGKLFLTDKGGSLHWFGLKMGGSVRWKLCREKMEFVGEGIAPCREPSFVRARALVTEKVWVGTDKVGLMEIWPGIPRFEDTREIQSVYSASGSHKVTLEQNGSALALPATPLRHSNLTLRVEGSYSGECVSVIVVRAVDLVPCRLPEGY